LRYSLSYRDLEEMMAERGLSVDHTTIFRWFIHNKEKSRMRSGKKFTTGFLSTLLCLMVILLAACGSNAPVTGQKAPVDKQVYVFPEDAVPDIATFDPGLSMDLNSNAAIDMVFTGLVQLDDQMVVRPQLASSWNLAPDGQTWTFHLRPNLKFSDGTSLTSADVAYSIDRALQPAEYSTVAPIYLALVKDSDKLVAGKIKTIINDSLLTPDPNTVIIKANKKAAYFLHALTYSCSYVIEKSLIDKYGKNFADHLTEGGGDGPFKVAEYTHNKQIVFVPNPNYYGPKPQLTKVIFPFYKDLETVYKAYQVGQVDTTGFYSIPSAHFQQAKTRTGEFNQVPQLYINYYTMNYLEKPFDNIHIRQAFALAINKSLIVHTLWKDSLIATNHIVPQGMPGYNPNLTGPDGTQSTSGNPTKAQALFKQGLQEEGWSSVSQMPPIKLTYAIGGPNADHEVAAIIQMWQSVLGVSVKADPIDFNKLLTEIEATLNNPHGLQFWGIAWNADYPDPQDWTTLQFDKGVPNNLMNYGQNSSSDAAQQQAVQQQLEAADVNPDQTSRLLAYNQAEQQLVNDVAWMPVEQVTLNVLLKPYVKGVVFNPRGLTSPNDWGAIYIAAH
jgi:oligopeptide transport system substrate-binding protein